MTGRPQRRSLPRTPHSGGAPQQPHAAVDVLGVRIRCLRTVQVLEILTAAMRAERPYAVYLVNAATANLAYETPAYRACLNRGDLVLNDGAGVRWAARLQGVRLLDNHVGTDLVPLLCRAASSWRARVFLFGGGPGVAERAGEALRSSSPGLQIVGCHHGFVDRADDERMCALINQAAPHLLLVAMGNPLQELWIDRNLPRLRSGLIVGVGGLFDHLAGRLRRAPRWVRAAGFEWLQLLLQQPHKWKRYVLGNPAFLYRMAFGRHVDA
jgi:N-acetylglucosaminyldiphosphoundecaprenol N-acetyl-beta-D-mannosaminyltransferase